jgi:release factor glutamine methyltransferase
MSGFFAQGTYWDLSADQKTRLDQGCDLLRRAAIPDPAKEAQALWAHCRAGADFADLIARRADHAPLSHLLGYRDFYKHRFVVTPDVLDPRPETEILVTTALEGGFDTVLDLGTGSGCILLSLLAERPAAHGVGGDISAAALAVAAQNRALLGLDGRADLVQSDWFAQLRGQFDLITANPPYIAADEMAGLAPEVRQHEPQIALTDQADGLSAYRAIAARAGDHLSHNGRLIVEIGPTQAAPVTALFAQAGFVDIRVIPDLDGRDRTIVAVWRANRRNFAQSMQI